MAASINHDLWKDRMRRDENIKMRRTERLRPIPEVVHPCCDPRFKQVRTGETGVRPPCLPCFRPTRAFPMAPLPPPCVAPATANIVMKPIIVIQSGSGPYGCQGTTYCA